MNEETALIIQTRIDAGCSSPSVRPTDLTPFRARADGRQANCAHISSDKISAGFTVISGKIIMEKRKEALQLDER
jgi:hypothetical protein